MELLKQLQALAQEKNWEAADIVVQLKRRGHKISPDTADNWLKGKHQPQGASAVKLTALIERHRATTPAQ